MPKFCSKSTNAVITYEALVGLVLFTLCGSSAVRADSFTVTLTPAEQTGTHGAYLSGPYNFGTAFSEIQSVTLQFMMPSGYQGTAVTTGNSSVFRSLSLLLHDAAMPDPDSWYNSAFSLGASAFNVPAGVPVEFGFVYSVSLGDDDSPLDWPDFVFTGMGQVGWTDEVHASQHPLPDGLPFSSSTSWLLPREIQSAQLTIVGTPVPEPGSILLLVAGAITVLFCRPLWRRSKAAGAPNRS